MAQDFWNLPIEYIKGVGPARADLLKKELEIFTLKDLIYHIPFRYIDRSRFYTVNEFHQDLNFVQVKGKILDFGTQGVARKQRLTALFSDGKDQFELVWFSGIKWISPNLKTGIDYVVSGKPTLFNGKWNIAHPELELLTPGNLEKKKGLQPVYPSSEKLKARGLDQKAIWKIIGSALEQVPQNLPENLPPQLVENLKLPTRWEALVNLHFPPDQFIQSKSKERLKIEELFFVQLKLLYLKAVRLHKFNGFIFKDIDNIFNPFYYNHLPFQLTNAQKRVLKEIRRDVLGGKQMNRLIQGDVGSGKTIVALLSMLMALDNGFQATLMAPTEILANQHFEGLSALCEKAGIECALLTGSTKKSQRKIIDERLKNNDIKILIGTHAILEDTVVFNNLGLVVIDEQHRFGVRQRSKMWAKNDHPPHVLVMTATPIPRTLALTLYGDLDVSVIDELPPGRKPIQTSHYYLNSRERVYQFVRSEIAKGRQVYMVYPLIEESETLDLQNLMDGFEMVKECFPEPAYKVSMVHGRMKASEKDAEMQRFVNGETQIMVATTVIEVGVNVPNASVMIIENSERFGLAQLHQLRGRVGRGADQSYCILMTDVKLSKESRIRTETMVRTNDGFEIAEIDLQLRGPGDLAGTQQSGVLDLKLSNLATDTALLQVARDAALELLEEDYKLELPQHYNIREHLLKFYHLRSDWSRIS